MSKQIYAEAPFHRAAIRRPIHHKIPRPDVAWIRCLHRITHRCARTPFSFIHRSYAKPFLSPHALDAFAIDGPVFATQQLMNKPIPPTRVFFRQGDHSLLQALPPVRRPLRSMIITRRRQIDHARSRDDHCGFRTIGVTCVVPAWISVIISNPCRSYSEMLRGFDDSR